ncbi:MAG: hypothetical protein K6G49_01145 [Candidatus Saccharibacteria bacterium]|nr:hypothetical protein [Candidatus Saccharibacteria bacterium]
MNELLTFGYIDPSVMTYAIQAGAGVVIAIGAFLGLYFKKTKKKVNKKLGIDENRNKEVESDEIEIKKSEPKKKTTTKKQTTTKAHKK